MEFGDTVYAAALVLLCYVVLFVPLNLFLDFVVVLMPASIIFAFLLSGLITGCVFAGKLADHRATSIGKILLIMAIFVVFFILTSNFIDWTAYKEIYSTTWTAAQWSREMMVMLYMTMALYEATGLSIMFIGLYTGSLLRKPKVQK